MEDELMELWSQKAGERRSIGTSVSQPQTISRTIGSADGAVEYTSGDPEIMGRYKAPEPVMCEYCGKPRYTRGIMLCGKLRWQPTPMRCDCPEAVARYEAQKAGEARREAARAKEEEERRMRAHIQRLIGDSGMNRRFLCRTFENMKVTADNKKAVSWGKAYAEGFEGLKSEKNGLMIFGSPGTGKTHLAAAIANRLISRGTGVICMTMIDLLARIKQSFDRRDEEDNTILDLYKTVPLLIIDDMGKEQPTDWAISTIYNIINGRYEGFMPTVITSNYDPDMLAKRLTLRSGDSMTAQATMDRLTEMCHPLTMYGPSWRK